MHTGTAFLLLDPPPAMLALACVPGCLVVCVWGGGDDRYAMTGFASCTGPPRLAVSLEEETDQP